MATIKKAAYLPDVWDNEEEMRGLMSYLKARHTNPTNYDRVINFWKKLIEEYCDNQKTCVFTLDELKIKFRRGTQLASPLATVITELEKSGTLLTKDEFDTKNKGWLEWGTSLLNPTSWFSIGSGSDSDPKKCQLIHLPALKKQARELLEFYRNNFDMTECPEIIAFDDLASQVSHIVNKESFEYVIKELNKMGEVSLGRSKDGERVIKFKEQSSQGPAKFTEVDANVHDLRRTMHRLDLEIKKAEQKEQMLKDDARSAMARKDKKAALNIMRKVTRVRKELADKDVQYHRLLGMLEQLAQTKQTKEIIEVYKAGSKAFKETLARQGMTPETVDVTIESVHEIMQDYNDVEEALRDGFRALPAGDSMDEAELESELNELLGAEEEKVPKEKVPTQEPLPANKVRIGKRVLDLGDLPEVPSSSMGSPRSVAQANGNGAASLEERWKRLRMHAT